METKAPEPETAAPETDAPQDNNEDGGETAGE